MLFSYNAKNFMTVGKTGNSIRAFPRGFVLAQTGTKEKPQDQGEFVAFVDDPAAVVDHCWFRGGWWDSVTMVWKTIPRASAGLPPSGAGKGARRLHLCAFHV